MTRSALVGLVLLVGCHGKRGVDPAEVERLRVEQQVLRDKIDALQSRLDRQQAVPATAPVTTAPPPTAALPPAEALAKVAAAPPSFESGSDVSALLQVLVPQGPAAAAPTPTTLRTDDLHGASISASLGPSDPTAASGIAGATDEQARALLDQLQAQMQTMKNKQAEEAAALDAIEKLK